MPTTILKKRVPRMLFFVAYLTIWLVVGYLNWLYYTTPAHTPPYFTVQPIMNWMVVREFEYTPRVVYENNIADVVADAIKTANTEFTAKGVKGVTWSAAVGTNQDVIHVNVWGYKTKLIKSDGGPNNYYD